ncbi:MAG: DUF4345 domain-containing protein [Reyranella sp.]|nr:DUF4345 domain-containing protein [Reyranella sp.]
MTPRRALQALIAIAAMLPVAGGLWEIAHGASGAVSQAAPGDGWTDNHRRYLGGLLLAIGLAYWSAVPGIEHKTGRLRLLAALVAIGGLARLVGLALGDPPTGAVAAALVMELMAAPLVCVWQARLATRQDLSGIAKPAPHLRHIGP